MNFSTHCNLIHPMYLMLARKIDKTISKLMYIQCERQKTLASYTILMGGPLWSMCSIEKHFFFTKVGYKQLRLRSVASFTNTGPDTYILLWKHCHTSVAS